MVLVQPAVRCEGCNFLLSATKKVPGKGPLRARLMFVGEAPGVEEDRLGEPFVGDAGKLLDRLFQKLGINRDSIYITNACKCRPPNNRTPRDVEIKNCLPWLKEEIETVNPVVIVALGKTALYTLAVLYKLSVDDKISKMVGKILYTGKQYIVPAYHPAFLLRHPDVKYKYEMLEATQKSLKLLEVLEDQEVSHAVNLFNGHITDVQTINV